MKSAFTTSGNEFMNQVRSKVEVPFSEKCVLLFTCFPAFGTGTFSIQYIEDETPFLITRKWEPDANSAYPLGIHLYDLNNIFIEERKNPVSESECEWICGIKQMDWTVRKSDGIMLDGVLYSLTFEEKTIRWTYMDKVSPELETALDKLCRVAGFLLK